MGILDLWIGGGRGYGATKLLDDGNGGGGHLWTLSVGGGGHYLELYSPLAPTLPPCTYYPAEIGLLSPVQRRPMPAGGGTTKLKNAGGKRQNVRI